MKLMTLNLNAKPLEQDAVKYKKLANYINQHEIDVIFLQEVSQLNGSYELSDTNVIYNILHDLDGNYYYKWIPIHHSYDKYVEGVAIITKYEIIDSEEYVLTKSSDYNNWRTRKLLLVNTLDKGVERLFGVTHTGWVDDLEEPFELQKNKLKEALNDREIIFGVDLNVIQGSQEYTDFINELGLTNLTESGYSFKQAIDGWTENENKIKVDYIFTNKNIDIIEEEMILNDSGISDHNGFYCQIGAD